jgi:SLBB domain
VTVTILLVCFNSYLVSEPRLLSADWLGTGSRTGSLLLCVSSAHAEVRYRLHLEEDELYLAGAVAFSTSERYLRESSMKRCLLCLPFLAGLTVWLIPSYSQELSKPAMVYVVGDVHRAGGFRIENGITVLQAIAKAEGANPDAALNKARLIRKTAAGSSEIALRLRDMLAGKAPDVHLQAQDIVWVPSNGGKLRVVPSVYQDAPLYKGAPAPLQEPQDP